MRRLSLLAAVVAVFALAGCANFPRAQFRISAFGFEAGVDTRKLTDDIGDVTASMVRGVGLEPPVIDASATATAAAPADAPK